MATTNFNTANDTFRKLIGNGLTYCIPRFQRDYSWSNDEWEDLWADIQATLATDGEPSHYMGYLVLQSTDDKVFQVIDGQQRLTTLSLVVLAVLNNIQRLIDADDTAEANQRRRDQIRQTYLGYLDPVTLVARPKLKLNRNNDDYFQNHLLPLGKLPKRGLRASEHLLRKAFDWFDKRILDFLKAGVGDPGQRLAQLVEDISDRLFFTVITVTDELNAYKVFETLNARGVRLSATDLLRNYLFSILDRGGERQHELDRLESRWDAIVGRLQAENFPDFLRVHWNSRHRFARQADLFKTIRGQITDRQAVFQLLRNMEDDLDTYLALSSPESSGWPQEDQEHVRILKTFRVRQPFPLLLAAHRRFDASDFSGLLRAIVVISLRYNVIGTLSTAEQERLYNSIAERLAKGELDRLNPTLHAMRSIYVDDRAFHAAFAERSIRSTDTRNDRVVRFLLSALEQKLSGQVHALTSDAISIEHILPQNAPDGWGGFSNEEANHLVHRLGNMTLLQTGDNRALGTAEYPEKRPRYQQSRFELSRTLANENSEWTPERIAARQHWMADQATSIWRIAQLS